jgi:dTDP-4-amino-4,6-dideoxygalactose transaminase
MQEIKEAIDRVLQSGQFILGAEVKAFEKEFAEFCGVKYAVGVANGTEALYIALKSVDIGPGDEVITVSHTASATICAIKMTGAKPVFVDIEERSMLINPDLIKKAITPKTRAIVPVHLYGRMCNMKSITKIADSLGIFVIEDCAQSVGAGKLYSYLGCYSFYPTKNLGGIGDGGCVITNVKALADKVKSLREYGYGERFVSMTFVNNKTNGAGN